MDNPTEKSTSQSTTTDDQLFVVGIGASAGGLNALDELFDHLPSDSGAAYVVIQHLSPDYKSLMKELLERHTDMTIYRIKEGMELQPNSVYLIPPGQNLLVSGKTLHLQKRKQDRNDRYELNFPIDIFFDSLAKNYQEKAIGVILSGSGTDGTKGLKKIKEAGGLAFVQEASTAEFDGMPRSAISSTMVDSILPLKDLAEIIYNCIIGDPEAHSIKLQEEDLLSDRVLRRISGILMEQENLNFAHYKARTISRRIHRRFLIRGLNDIKEYVELLENDVEERNSLCKDLLINVTSFFRDAEAWLSIENTVLPAIIEQAEPHQELRFWVAACSTGQEAYSLAILIHEAIQLSDKPLTVKMFATDIDRAALEIASAGKYPLSIAEEIPHTKLNRYFIAQDNCYQVTRTLREMIIFSYHDLTKDAGFTRMNLVSCRNALIYMQSSLQDKVVRDLHFALVHRGTLFLGEAETPGSFGSEFYPLNKKWKLYQKRRNVRLPINVRHSFRAIPRHSLSSKVKPDQYFQESVKEKTLKSILQADKAIALAINRENQLLYVCGDAQHIFKTPDGEVTRDITKMVVLPLQLPLNTAIHRAKKKKEPVAYRNIKLNIASAIYQINLQVFPPDADSHDDLFIIKIEPEETPSMLPVEEFETNTQAQQRINELELELQYTRENLQAIVEELESSNEEQQASNEELIASNEELQSTNEELHSVNEEIHTVNAEYQSKIQELTELGNDIDNLLQSTKIGVIFLDRELKIRKFTPAATEVIALRHTDVERPLEDLFWKIECSDLLNLLHQVLETRESQELEVRLKQAAEYFLMGINLYQTDKVEEEGLVLTFVKISETKKAQLALKERERSFQAIFNSTFQFIGVLTPAGITLEANQTILDFGGISLDDVLGKPFWTAKWWSINEATQQQLKNAIARAAEGEFVRYEVDVIGVEERVATIDFSIKPVFDEAGKVVQLIPEGREISELKKTREELKQTNLDLENRVAERTQTLTLFSARLQVIHRLAISHHQEIEDLFVDYLRAGCHMLNLSTGIISQVSPDYLYKVVAVESPLDIVVGYEVSCADTYCAEVIETQATVTFNRVGEIEAMKNHPVYLDLKLESFISTPIFVNGQLYGTLNFSDTNPRKQEFTEEEKEIVELMARDIGNSIAAVQAEEALKESEIRFRNTFEQVAVGVAHVSPGGRFLKVNQRLCDILAYDNNTLLNQTFMEITHPEDLTIDIELVQKMLTGEINNYSLEKRYVKSDRSIVWSNLTVSLVRNNLGHPEYFISVIEDISDRKQAEAALEESRMKLKQANQAKDNFIAHMSHELRTPLTNILGFSKLLHKKDSLLPSKRLYYANIVHQSGEHLLALINDILDFSRITASQLKLESENFNLISFLWQVTSALRIRAQEKGIKLSSIFSPALPITVNGDFNRLRQVLYNLIGNAIKFTDQGGVTLKVSCIPLDTDAESAKTANVTHIRFEVEDTGIGIAQDKLSNIFAPFEQLNSNTAKHKGTGLGLTISQNIVGLMNSKIFVESEEGRGSKFWFDLDLPSVAENLPIICSSSGWQQNRQLKTPQKILVVDDSEESRILLDGLLQPLGFIVEQANNGAVAIGVAKFFQPDAILTDLIMPVMDGKEMIARIKQQPQLKHIPIFMISANSQMIVKPDEVDCEEFLPKPFDLEKLLDLLEVYLDLDWQIDEDIAVDNNSSNLDVPPRKEILRLLELASFGDLEALEEQIDSLVTLEAKYNDFAQEIKQLAGSFQQNQLESFLENIANQT